MRYSTLKRRPMLKTKMMHPGSFRSSVIICSDKIESCTSVLYHAYQKTAAPDLFWILDHGNSSAVENVSKPFETG